MQDFFPQPTRRGRTLGRARADRHYYTPQQFAEAIGLSVAAVLRMVADHRVDSAIFGTNRILIPVSELDRPEFDERRRGIDARARQLVAV
jgi:hypothetical protein